MSLCIHHGPNGSFKSFGIVQRQVLPALLAGRTVVTNVKGLDCIDTICEAMDVEVPDTARLIFVKTKGSHEGKEKMRNWFHWVPFGALIVIDECQTIYREKEFKAALCDLPEGTSPVEYISEGGEVKTIERPWHIWEAFEEHRHFEWDIFFCSPNIGKVHKELRQNTEWAYRHRDRTGILPWKKHPCWSEIQHDPENAGKTVSSYMGEPAEYKADVRVFNCYRSTETGEHKGSSASRSIFQDRKIRTTLYVMGFAFFCFFALLIFSFSGGSDSEKINGMDMAEGSSKVVNSGVSSSNGSLSDAGGAVGTDVAPIDWSFKINRVQAHFSQGGVSEFIFEVIDGENMYSLSSHDLTAFGFKTKYVSPCAAIISKSTYRRLIVCKHESFDLEDESQRYASVM